MKLPLLPALAAAILLCSTQAIADGTSGGYVFTITNDYKLTPQELIIPANQKVKLTIQNLGNRVVEFESAAINREINIPAHGMSVVYVGPLQAGTYNFFDEVHRGVLTANIIVQGSGGGGGPVKGPSPVTVPTSR